MTLDPGAAAGSAWAFGLPPVVSAMLSGVFGRVYGLYGFACVAGAPMCITDTFFFACDGSLGYYSDVLIGPPVFLLDGKEKSYFNLSSGWASDFRP